MWMINFGIYPARDWNLYWLKLLLKEVVEGGSISNEYLIYLLEEGITKHTVLFPLYLGCIKGLWEEPFLMGFEPQPQALRWKPGYRSPIHVTYNPEWLVGNPCIMFLCTLYFAKSPRSGNLTTVQYLVSELSFSIFLCKQYSLGNCPTNRQFCSRNHSILLNSLLLGCGKKVSLFSSIFFLNWLLLHKTPQKWIIFRAITFSNSLFYQHHQQCWGIHKGMISLQGAGAKNVLVVFTEVHSGRFHALWAFYATQI